MSEKYYTIFCASDCGGYYDGCFYGIYFDREEALAALKEHVQETFEYHAEETPDLAFFQEMEEGKTDVTIHVFSEPYHDESEWSYEWTMHERSLDDHSVEAILSV